jgi:hypothetical protein
MKKKGQADIGIGVILITFITVLVGVIFFQSIAQQAGEGTSLVTVTELSLGTQTNGTTYYLTDYRALSDVVIRSDTTTLDDGNYTVTNNVIDPTTGGLAVSILPASEYSGQTWVLNATAQPVTYIAESGGRAMAGLIAIFFALAVAVVALIPTLRSGVLNMIK